MKKTLFTFILLLTLLHQEAISQSISINSANNYLCTGNTFKITFSSSGVDADKLSLEIGVKGAQSFMKLNTQRNGDTLSAVVPQNIQEFNHIGLNSRYLIRISSSSPLVKSDTREVDMLDKINFKLSGQIAIGPYENTILTPIVSGKLPYIVKFSNGMEARVDNNTPITVSPVKETVYTPVSVINTCGSGEVSGSQTVIVQPIGLRISSTNLPLGYCAGGFFYVNIIKSAPFNKDNHFTVQQKDNNNNYNDWETTMVNDTLLKVRVPDNMPNQGVNYLRVVGTSPSIISRDFPVQTVIIKRSVKLIPTRITEKNRPYFSMQGSTVGGSSVTLSNGITYSSLDWVYEYDYLMPSNETQTYTITKAEDACGAIPLDENTGSFTVKKIPDVSIFITTGSVSICEGVRTPINIPVFFGQNVEENGDFKLEFSSGDSWNDDPEEVVTARLSSDKKTLIADFPNEFYKRFENPSAPRFFYGKIYNEKL
ncbi:MAG TPA: hypothetical protein VGE24_09975, partial [Emticicia sp.]